MVRLMEKRSQAGHEDRSAGELIWDGGAQRHSCTISDISIDGARVDTRFFVYVPERLFLLESDTGNLFECRVRWQQSAQMDVSFIDIGSQSLRRALMKQHSMQG
jgi:hypothetical protein